MQNQANLPLNNRKTNILYSLLQFIYWAMNCSVYSFAALFFMSKGESSAQLGIILAVANTISAFLQPFISQYMIKKHRFSLVKTIILLNSLAILALIFVILFKQHNQFIALLYGSSVVFILTLQPFVNALGFEFINHDIPLNFGISRGAGSIGYAVSSFLVGQLLAATSKEFLPMIVLIISLLLFIPLLALRVPPSNQTSQDNNTQHYDIKTIFSKYPFLLSLLIGFSALFIFHSFISSFMSYFLLNLGGNAKDVGTAFMIAGFCEIPAMFLFTRLIEIKSSKFWVSLSAAFFFIRSIAILLATSVPLLLSSQTLQALSFALFIPATAYMFNQYLDSSDSILGQTLITATMTIGGVFGNLLAGQIVTMLGIQALFIFGIIIAGFGWLMIQIGLRKML